MQRSRVALGLAVLAVGGGIGALPALADDQSVVAMNLHFTPKNVAVRPGETVTISNQDSVAHNLQFADEASRRAETGLGWTVTRTFTAGEARDAPYRYFCNIHFGMEGFVYVNATGTVPVQPTPTPSATATPSPSPTATPTATSTPHAGGTPVPAPTPAGTGAPASGAGSPAAVRLRSARVLAARACRPGAKACRGVVLRLDLSAPASVRGSLRRRGAHGFAPFGTVRLGRVAAGPHTVAFARTRAGRRLRPGRYRLALHAGSAARTVAFRVRPAR
jgi:plastocyanin